MRKVALVLAVMMLLAVGTCSIASADDSIFQQMADSISTWSWSGS